MKKQIVNKTYIALYVLIGLVFISPGYSLEYNPASIYPSVAINSITTHNITITNNESNDWYEISLESELGYYSGFTPQDFSLTIGQSQLVKFNLTAPNEQGKYDDMLRIYKNGTLDYELEADFRALNLSESEEGPIYLECEEIDGELICKEFEPIFGTLTNLTEITEIQQFIMVTPEFLDIIQSAMNNQTLNQELLLELIDESLQERSDVWENSMKILMTLDTKGFPTWQRLGDLQNMTGLNEREFNTALRKLGDLKKIMQDTRIENIPTEIQGYYIAYPTEVIYYASADRYVTEKDRDGLNGIITFIVIMLILYAIFRFIRKKWRDKIN